MPNKTRTWNQDSFRRSKRPVVSVAFLVDQVAMSPKRGLSWLRNRKISLTITVIVLHLKLWKPEDLIKSSLRQWTTFIWMKFISIAIEVDIDGLIAIIGDLEWRWGRMRRLEKRLERWLERWLEMKTIEGCLMGTGDSVDVAFNRTAWTNTVVIRKNELQLN